MSKQIYYHFLSYKNAIDDLVKERIKVSKITDLNDPFELLPNKNFRKREKRVEYDKAREEFSDKFGLLSFCKYWDKPLLWGHYANKCKGVAFGFNVRHKELKQVQYICPKQRPKFEISSNIKENEKHFLDLAILKHEYWQYENEYRLLIDFSKCKSDKGMHFLPLDDSLKIKEIILGSELKFNNSTEMLNLIDLKEKHEADIIPARLAWKEFQINKCGTKTKMLEKITNEYRNLNLNKVEKFYAKYKTIK